MVINFIFFLQNLIYLPRYVGLLLPFLEAYCLHFVREELVCVYFEKVSCVGPKMN